ncbi:MAG: Thioredoxin [Candidatus Heimdallarchaeota archaeon LC_3]|nr:MAG: Thioredoxin [Candidatus Heimdallarchaeota archaeon LC_3]
MQIIEMKDIDDWKQTIEKNKIVITDFWAGWCRPCLMLGDTMKKMAKEDEGKLEKIVIAKIDTEANEFKQLSQELQITSIPSMFVYLNGKQLIFQTGDGKIDRIMGALPRTNLEKLFETLITESEKTVEATN